MLVGNYSIKNLIQSEEFLLELTQVLKNELSELEKAKNDVKAQQDEAQKQGNLVKKMTNYLSEELGRLEMSSSEHDISPNLAKLSDTEKKLRLLRGRLNEFIHDDEAIKESNQSLGDEIKKYESFLLDLTNTINEKISSLEKITSRLQAERREFEHQKMLLKEMADLFNDEVEDLEKTFSELKNSD